MPEAVDMYYSDFMEDGTHNRKISPEFEARLEELGPGSRVRAVILLQSSSGSPSQGRRQSPGRRKAAISRVRDEGEKSLGNIDRVLSRFNGKRISRSVDSLGSITVESTAPGIRALSDCPGVKAILEDQAIHHLDSLSV